ncbi:sulfotransferase [Actinoplanes sp. NPDC051513]|uniref:sulfotransferase n=1 Tax=Actinoplanes sp. NPDC051513 TaxID=3363908 RepID=UPI0037B8FA02
MPDVEPYLLHMIRDPRAVTHSWMRAAPPPEKRKSSAKIYQRPAASTVHWLARNVLTERLASCYPGRHVRLRYEDFAANPREVIERILTMTGTPATDGPFIDDNTVELDPNHTIAGNPSRFRNGKIALTNDDRWRAEQRSGPRLTSTALALPLAAA